MRERDVVHLHVLARGKFSLAARVTLGDLAENPQRGSRQDAARDLDPHHERADLWLIGVQPKQLKPKEAFFGRTIIRRFDHALPLICELHGEKLALEALDRISFQNKLP